MKRITFLLLLAAALVPAGEFRCPIDDLVGVRTGYTRFVEDVMLVQYRCPKGHVWWVRG
jgi:hypothetical protein